MSERSQPASPGETVGTKIRVLIRERAGLVAGTAALSAALVSVLILLSDADVFAGLLAEAGWPWLAVGFGLLLLEGIATSLRLRRFAGSRPRISCALQANAWYALALVVLPARLGEVAGVFVLRHFLDQNPTAGTMSVLVQRAYDVACIAGVTLLAVVALRLEGDTSALIAWAVGITLAAVAVLVQLGALLTLLARLIRRTAAHLGRLGTRAFRIVLRARVWQRHHLAAGSRGAPLLLTLAKWGANLGGLTLIMAGLRPDLPSGTALAVAGCAAFLAMVPLQLIGGIGVSDIGVASLLVALGDPLALAAATSVGLRAALILAPVSFWVAVRAGFAWRGRRRHIQLRSLP